MMKRLSWSKFLLWLYISISAFNYITSPIYRTCSLNSWRCRVPWWCHSRQRPYWVSRVLSTLHPNEQLATVSFNSSTHPPPSPTSPDDSWCFFLVFASTMQPTIVTNMFLWLVGGFFGLCTIRAQMTCLVLFGATVSFFFCFFGFFFC